ncbi:hypothetical protein EBU99_09750 [bacterium]|nr:hypothetical protein [bacterium]
MKQDSGKPLFMSGSLWRKIWCAALIALLVGCQPQTRQDRAGVGPEVTPSADEPGNAQSNADVPGGKNSAADGSSASAAWESSLKTLCEQGKPSACSQLAYEAQRAKKFDEALALFTRACLMNEVLANCAQPTAQSQGGARSCFEVVALQIQKGKNEDAARYKTCACERRFKPACL